MDFNTGKPDDFIQFVSEDFLKKEGFVLTSLKGEVVWKKGVGVLSGPQFVKLQYSGGMVHLEAWIKYAILPGVYCGEMGLDGAMGFAVKAALKNKVNALVALLYQPANIPGAPVSAPYSVSTPSDGVGAPVSAAEGAIPAGSATPAYNGVPTAPIPVAVHNPTNKATLSLVMGLCSIAGCFFPIAGVILGAIGIPAGVVGRKSTARGMATAGLVLSILFLVISILNWIAGIILTVML